MTTAKPSVERDTATPDAAELVTRVKDLHPLLTKNGPVGEQHGRVTEESIQALTDAGLFRLTVPKRHGGYQTSLRTYLDVTAAVAEADGGTAWLVTLTNVGNWLASLFTSQAQDEVFGTDPNAKVSSVLAATSESRRVRGGWRVTGKWHYHLGSSHSTWLVLGIPLTDDAGDVVDQGLALFPRSEVQLEDTWPLTGMRSTGCNAVSVDDAFVPAHRILRTPDAIDGIYPSEHTDTEPLYRSAFVPMLALALVGPQLGLGKAALEYVIGNADKTPISYTFFEAQRDSVAFQLQIAEAARLVDTAHLHAYRAARDIDEAAARGLHPDLLTRARVRSDTGYAAESIGKAIDTLITAHGVGTFAETNPLQRIWRDSATAARHAVTTPSVSYEVYGKALLGVDECITPFV